MSFGIVALISLAVGLFLVIGGGIVVYMGQLVKNGYELKVEVKSDISGGFQKIEEETDKKVRWIKRDLVDDIEKAKAAMQADNSKKFNDLMDSVNKRMAEIEETQLRERSEVAKSIEGLRRDVIALDQRLRGLRRDQRTELERAREGDPATASQNEVPPAPESPGQGVSA